MIRAHGGRTSLLLLSWTAFTAVFCAEGLVIVAFPVAIRFSGSFIIQGLVVLSTTDEAVRPLAAVDFTAETLVE